MRRVGIVYNENKDPSLIFTRRLEAWLAARGAAPALIDADETAYALDNDYDCLVCLGGDGTLLKAAGGAAVRGIPLIGINLGNIGYLTDVQADGAEAALAKLLNGDYTSERRMMLDTDLTAYGVRGANPALNEVCIIKGVHTKMIRIKIWINDEYIDAYRADGVIIATPTGSTAYNLSAGGPILKPDGNMIAVTPICSHALYTRPFVISADDTVTVQVEESRASDITLLMDGRHVIGMRDGDKILIKRSQYTTTIIKTNELGFYEILRQKLSV